jgi:ADP-heptose:LPS heptosyltransferase
MRILFITATRLGDAVLSTGLLAHLLGAYPRAEFTVACGQVAAGLFARMPRLERVLVVEKRRFDAHWLALWRDVVGTRWDLVVDLRGSGLGFFLRARRRLVMRGGRRKGHRLAHLGGVLGLEQAPLPTVWISAGDRQVAAAMLPPGGVYVGLGPTANWAGKIWPPERFVDVFRAIRADLPGAVPAVFGAPGEAALAAPVVSGLPDAVDLVGKLSLPEVAACLQRCVLFVGNDSGLMHLAAAAGTPTLGLFGPSQAGEYAPAGRCTAVAVADGPAGHARMQDLPVAAVLRVARTLLDGAAMSLPA